MTTNAGSECSSSVSGFAVDREVQNKERVEKALSKFLRPEFINRIDEIISFRHLTVSDFEKIADIMLRELRDHLVEKGISFVYDGAALRFIAEASFSEKFGARQMRRYIERNVEDEIANRLIDAYPTSITAVSVSAADGALKIDTI